MIKTLEQVLADTREDAEVLRRRGHVHDAELITKVCDDVAAALEDYLTWLPESKACLQSGHSRTWLRARFKDWQAAGHARWITGEREYRAIILPRRSHPELDYAAGERAADERLSA
jgi:hypothetical protein